MRILVAVDLSDSSETIVQKAEVFAKALSAEVFLLHVAEPEPDFVGYAAGPQTVRNSVAQHFHQEHRQLQDLGERLRKSSFEVTALLVQGPTVDTILGEASKLGVEMIVLGSHGRGRMYQLLVGSVSEGVLHRSECPVLVVPTHERN